MQISQEDLNRLSTHCDWAPDTFGLIIFYGTDADREMAVDAIRGIGAEPEIHSLTTTSSPTSFFEKLTETLTTTPAAQKPSPLWIDLTSPLLEESDLKTFFSRMNERRFFLEQQKRPVIFHLPTPLKNTHSFDYSAPDLFHIRSLQI